MRRPEPRSRHRPRPDPAASRRTLQLGDRLDRRPGRAVHPVDSHRRVGIGTRDDARLDRDLVAREAVRVARAVEPLVVVAHRRCGVGQAGDAAQDRLADLGVRAHHGPFGLVQRAGLREDGVGDRAILPRSWSQPASRQRITTASGSPTAVAIDAARLATCAQWVSAMPSRAPADSASACARRIASGSSATRSRR